MRKFIFSGPVGAGKTTAIKTLTGDEILHTDVKTSDSVAMRKETTTVAMDFGIVRLSNDELAHVYGTPGQERFDFMWDILSKNADGLVLLMDNSRKYPFRDLKYYLDAFKNLIKTTPFIVGVTRLEASDDSPTLKNYAYWLSQLDIQAPVIAVDARIEQDMQAIVEHLAGLQTLQHSQSPVATEVVPEASKSLNAEDTFKSLDNLLNIKGVEGIGLSDAYGEVLQSNYKDSDLEQISAYLIGMAETMNQKTELGVIKQIMIRSPVESSLHLYLDEEQTLSIETNKKVTMTALNQQVEDILQWS